MNPLDYLKVVENCPKGSVILWDESEDRIVINPSVSDILHAMSNKKKRDLLEHG